MEERYYVNFVEYPTRQQAESAAIGISLATLNTCAVVVNANTDHAHWRSRFWRGIRIWDRDGAPCPLTPYGAIGSSRY